MLRVQGFLCSGFLGRPAARGRPTRLRQERGHVEGSRFFWAPSRARQGHATARPGAELLRSPGRRTIVCKGWKQVFIVSRAGRGLYYIAQPPRLCHQHTAAGIWGKHMFVDVRSQPTSTGQTATRKQS